MKIIYDFGSNNGDDVSYYLKKADRVIAVEANPVLAKTIEERFAKEIQENRVIVISCVLTATDTTEAVPFYIHKTFHPGSQFPKPPAHDLHKFELVHLAARRASEIINTYGHPHYVKIDIEHYDQQILEDMFSAEIFPDYISAESHHINVFSTLVALGKYDAFKIIDGQSVPECYKNHRINTQNGTEQYSFPVHSAGPFADDINGPWLSANQMFSLLAYLKLGWKDIHASRIDSADLSHHVPEEIPLRILLKSLPKSCIQQFKRKTGLIKI